MPVLLGLKAAIRRFLPASWVQRINRWRGLSDPNEMPYAPEGWPKNDPSEATWGSDVAVDHYLKSWHAFMQSITLPGPLGMINPRQMANGGNVFASQIYTAFGYVLARTAHLQSELSILDWGGCLGQYAALTQRLIPGIKVKFYNKDLPGLRAAAEQVMPEATYFDQDDQFADLKVDLVMASGALQYTRSWQSVIERLTRSAQKALYLSRVPTCFAERSFVTLPRVAYYAEPRRIPMWIFSHDELAAEVARHGFRLEMEFVTSEGLKVINGPAPAEMRGYYFQRT